MLNLNGLSGALELSVWVSRRNMDLLFALRDERLKVRYTVKLSPKSGFRPEFQFPQWPGLSFHLVEDPDQNPLFSMNSPKHGVCTDKKSRLSWSCVL